MSIRMSSGIVENRTNRGILKDFCEWEHDFEEELNAVTSPKILKLLEEKKHYLKGCTRD